MRDQADITPPSRPAPLSLPLGAALPAPVSHARRGPGSLLALSSGSIAGDLRGIAVDSKRRVTTYELLVANETISPIATFAYVIGAAPGSMVSWNTITVPAFSAVALTMDVALPARGKEQRVVVELHAEDAHLTLDAKPPQAPAGKHVDLTAVLSLAACAAGVILYNMVQPRVSVLEAPSSVIAGKPFTVAYTIGGSATGSYLIETPSGFQVRRGLLDRSRNTLTMDLPEFPVTRGYDMRVTAQGKFSSQTRVIHITAIPPPVTPPPLHPPSTTTAQTQAGALPTITLANDTVPGGTPIALSYPAGAAGGTVTLYDQMSTVRGTTLLDKSGHAVLLAPAVSADQSMRIVVRVQSGNSTLESNAPITVKPQSAATPPPEMADASQYAGGAPFDIPLQTVKSGTEIRIPIARHEDALRITLSTTDGSVLSQTDVALSQNAVTLRAPTVLASTPYLLVGTYRRGVGQETIVRRITIAP